MTTTPTKTDAEEMQYASGYSLDLYCRKCCGPMNLRPSTYFGETFSECAKQARQDGWKIYTRARTALCPKCGKAARK